MKIMSELGNLVNIGNRKRAVLKELLEKPC